MSSFVQDSRPPQAVEAAPTPGMAGLTRRGGAVGGALAQEPRSWLHTAPGGSASGACRTPPQDLSHLDIVLGSHSPAHTPPAQVDVSAWSPGSCLLCLARHAIALARHVIRRRDRHRGRLANQEGARVLPSPGDEQEIGAHPTIGRPGHRGHPGIGDNCITASGLSALGDTSAQKASPIVPRPRVCRRWATPQPKKRRLSS